MPSGARHSACWLVNGGLEWFATFSSQTCALNCIPLAHQACRIIEGTEPFSQHIRTAQTALANKYAEHWCSLPESKEMVGEAEAPMNSKLSVGQLRNRVSSCVHLPMLFQLSQGVVSDMWCGALGALKFLLTVSSLIPKAWPRCGALWWMVSSRFCNL